jgi:hypothetical protein
LKSPFPDDSGNPHLSSISKFFIDRPIFAAVISPVIVLAGAIAVTALPVRPYPPARHFNIR